MSVATNSSAAPGRLGGLRRATFMDRPIGVRVLLLVLFLVVWDLIGRLGIADPLFVSSPGAVAGAIPDLASSGSVHHAFAVTGAAIAFAFVGGTVLGIIAGMSIGLSPLLRDAYFGTVLFIMGTPKSIFVPIFLLIFGTEKAAPAFGVFEAFFFVTVNVVGGVDLVEKSHRTMARAFAAPRLHQFRDVVLPAALPGVFAGLWYGIKNAFLGVLIVELYISVGGLGQVIKQNTEQLQTQNVFALVLGVSVIAVIVGLSWTRLERKLTAWKPVSSQSVH